MTVLEYKELTRKAAQKAGPGYLKVFAIYGGILIVLGFVRSRLDAPVGDWLYALPQYVAAGNLELPEFSSRLVGCLAFSVLLGLLARTVTAGWLLASLRATRGEAFSWHDLSAMFPIFWKVFVIDIVYNVCCTLACYLLIFPAVLLFYNWRLSYFVLAEHPDYGPLQCMRQSRRLMVGERMNLFKLDLSCILSYALVALLWFSSYGIVSLWKLPSLSLLYAVFYNKMSYWKDPAETQEPEAPKN